MKQQDLFDIRPAVKNGRLNVLPANPEQAAADSVVGLGRFPSWLHRRLPRGEGAWHTSAVMQENRLHTVCEEARCPNLPECWSKKSATFLVMGKECTRSCGFCSIDFSKQPQPLEANEPERVANSVQKLGLKHVVITMVARDDLPDGGAEHLAKVIKAIREQMPETTIEVLTSDFRKNYAALETVLAVNPEIFNHNLETVRALTPKVRHTATYDNSLAVLSYVKQYVEKHRTPTMIKSGLMVGLGESDEEIGQTLLDLKDSGCDIVTIGQYLQPLRNKLRVKAFITPQQFKDYEEQGHALGIKYMYCGPFVRSSYNADLVLHSMNSRK